jgi:BMFP domain-containing protein YqiC
MHDQAQSGASSPFTSGFSSAVPPFRPSPQMFEELQSRLRELLANSPAADIEKNMRLMLGSFFTRLDLVTREDFDHQTRLLASTREKLDAMEARVAALEAGRHHSADNIGAKPGAKPGA